MKLMSLSVIFVGATVLIIIGIAYLYLSPSIKSAWQNYQEINKSQETLNAISQKKEVLKKLSIDNQLDSVYVIASNYIPEEEKSGDLVIDLSEIAKQSNLKVEQISFDKAKASSSTKTETSTANSNTNKNTNTQDAQPAQDNNKAKEIEFSMKVSGTFSDYLNFINNLQKSDRLVTITSMDLTQATEGGFISSLEGKAYYQKANDLDTSLAAVDISQDIIEKFKNLKSYGEPINLQTESGFGRPDPFSTY